ncbi:enoyl-CoA hydratase/isomerase family protein [Pseudaestuariivita sp.]|uniref:enoyl-CoA hydratase/isomerase family protein n=1 Tax=Pseudaestuariivita sp. TaxID=2211669 RepID=UPI004058873C
MIDVTDTGALRRITLNRPDKANALTAPMLEGLIEAVTSAAEARALILTGAGKVFSAGADLEAARAGLATSPLWEELSGAVAQSRALTIAALNGTCAGGAMGMILACDLRVAVPGAKLFYPVMRLGFLPQPSDPTRLSALAGPSRARMILMAGQKVTAETALGWGLLDALADDPVAEAERLAADALGATAAHVAGIKALLPNGDG